MQQMTQMMNVQNKEWEEQSRHVKTKFENKLKKLNIETEDLTEQLFKKQRKVKYDFVIRQRHCK